MENVADRLQKNVDSMAPCEPFHFTKRNIGNVIPQGDLDIEVMPDGIKPPAGYVLVDKPTDADRQLAVEAGAGSHHRLASMDGVKLYRPKDWGKDDADLRGPFVVFAKPNAIVHEPGHDRPHATAFADEPCSVQIHYQRNLDAETRREIRARD